MKKRIATAAGLAAALLICYFAINASNQQLFTNTFNRIYAEGTWGKDLVGKGTSGTGSTLAITREYRAYVEDFVKRGEPGRQTFASAGATHSSTATARSGLPLPPLIFIGSA